MDCFPGLQPRRRSGISNLLRLTLALALPVAAGCRTTTEADAEPDLLARWNAAVDATPGVSRDFHWTEIDQFPHPTFRYGDQIAYTGFTDVLLTFYATGDNLGFMEGHGLLDRDFQYSAALSPPSHVTFRGFTRMLSTYTLVAPDRREKLQRVCAAAPSPC